MIEVYKVMGEKYDPSSSIQIPTNEESFTRDNKLFKDSFRLDIRNSTCKYLE